MCCHKSKAAPLQVRPDPLGSLQARPTPMPAGVGPGLAKVLLCSCGNTFMPDAIYCRKCARRRPASPERLAVDRSGYAAPMGGVQQLSARGRPPTLALAEQWVASHSPPMFRTPIIKYPSGVMVNIQ